ncbi:MAG: DUF2085 domain-containing protein [Clostridia bacterium]|nr:DUF2085 domain-containing protein [Clostridia bacterium]MBQ4098493.1 DUF2085 domain-containing protein [Clostridia bacterium]
MIDFILKRFALFGVLPLCNLNAKRGFFIGSFCFPLCTRCTALIVGFLLTFIIGSKLRVKGSVILLFVGVFCTIPCLIDGLLQYLYNIESTNFRRITLGLLGGFGIGNIAFFIIRLLNKILLKK